MLIAPVQAEVSPDEARRRSMELHQLHSEPKESGHCDIDYRMDAALQGNILVSSQSLHSQAASVVIAAAGIIHGAAHGCLSLACLVGYGVCTLSQARVPHAHCVPPSLNFSLLPRVGVSFLFQPLAWG